MHVHTHMPALLWALLEVTKYKPGGQKYAQIIWDKYCLISICVGVNVCAQTD